ncbi:unnamed protein product [Porites lobata]|uniref:Tyr recombinase domain-containing protein n=1 Tax=Porites lobata TaxID=104759 RepID=A0ABN8RDF9_9CNID|nr:unnamed protein product [Porites lobata]
MVKMMMAKAGIKGYFTHHSLRATAVSRLSQEGVNDKLIRGVTGHRLEALPIHLTGRRETNEQLLSKIVQGRSIETTTTENVVAAQIPNSLGSINLNISGGNCNITSKES